MEPPARPGCWPLISGSAGRDAGCNAPKESRSCASPEFPSSAGVIGVSRLRARSQLAGLARNRKRLHSRRDHSEYSPHTTTGLGWPKACWPSSSRRLDTPEHLTYSFLKAISFLRVHASWGVCKYELGFSHSISLSLPVGYCRTAPKKR
jgi:hypothetical protein